MSNVHTNFCSFMLRNYCLKARPLTESTPPLAYLVRSAAALSALALREQVAQPTKKKQTGMNRHLHTLPTKSSHVIDSNMAAVLHLVKYRNGGGYRPGVVSYIAVLGK